MDLRLHINLKHKPSIRVSTPKPKEKYKCEFCDFVGIKETLKSHIVREHTHKNKELPFKCDLCDFSTATEARV